jgi:hypothetical protein
MPDFNPFDMDFDGDVDGIDFLGFDYLTRHVLKSDQGEEGDDTSDDDGQADDDKWDDDDRADDDEWDDDDEADDY